MVINLIFLRLDSLEYNNHSIHPEWCLTSNHIPLSVDIAIFKENIQTKKHTIIKDSEEEDNFVSNLIEAIKGLNMDDIQIKEDLKHIIQTFADCMKKIWYKHLKIVNITKYSKVWWNENCYRSLENYRHMKRLKYWKIFKSIVRKTKHSFFNLKIQEIANKNCGLWKLMDWVKKQKIPAIEAIQYNRYPYIELNDL